MEIIAAIMWVKCKRWAQRVHFSERPCCTRANTRQPQLPVPITWCGACKRGRWHGRLCSIFVQWWFLFGSMYVCTFNCDTCALCLASFM